MLGTGTSSDRLVGVKKVDMEDSKAKDTISKDEQQESERAPVKSSSLVKGAMVEVLEKEQEDSNKDGNSVLDPWVVVELARTSVREGKHSEAADLFSQALDKLY
jgi:hypothetical protein